MQIGVGCRACRCLLAPNHFCLASQAPLTVLRVRGLKRAWQTVSRMPTIVGRNPRTGELLQVRVQDGLIHDISAAAEDEGAWLSPGLIDLQVNGFFGYDVNGESSDPETIIALTHAMIATGVTTFLPTIITAAEEEIICALRAVAVARQRSQIVADAVPFVHVEGPNICAEDGPRGAHPREHVRTPDLGEFERWQRASDGLVGMVTLSPHFDGVDLYIAELRRQGVHVAIGHTNASVEQIHRAIDAGANLSTHLGNGIGGTIPRHSNVLWPQLSDDRLTATLIADGHHLPADALRAIIKAKGVDRSILVSDAVALGGLPAGVYETRVGGRVELNSSGRLSLAGTEFLAGAALPLKDGVARAISMAGISLSQSLAMATRNPGRFVDRAGELRIGAPADLILFTLDEAHGRMILHDVFLKGERWKS
jgi:N-acetylglucosamine-6-phosphate deacetylase